MGIFLNYFTALAISIKTKKSFSISAPMSIIMIILIEYILANLGFMEKGVYVCLFVVGICFIYCAYNLFKDGRSVVSQIVSPASIAYIVYILLFCMLNIGRGFIDSDDMLGWGLDLKKMCYYNALKVEEVQFLSDYPSATQMWGYFANKTWSSFSEGISLWAYDVYSLSFLLILFDFVKKKDKLIKFIGIFFPTIAFSFMTYDNALNRLSGNILLAFMLFWGMYCAYEYLNKNDIVYYVACLLAIFAMTLAIRLGVTMALGVVAFMTFSLLKSKYRFAPMMIGLLIAVNIVAFISYMPDQYYIALAVSLFSVALGMLFNLVVSRIKKVNLTVLLEGILSFTVITSIFAFSFIRDHYNNGGKIVTLFFKQVFTTKEGNVINSLPISLGGILVLFCFGLFFYYCELKKKKKLDLIHRNNLFWGIFIIISSLEILAVYLLVYASSIGIEPGMNRLPSFYRYTTPCVLVPILFIMYILLQEFSDKFGKQLGIGFVVSIIFLVDCSRPVDFILNKYIQPEYHAFEAAGVELNEGDKIFYINNYDQSGLFTDISFYYQMMPATSNCSRAYAWDADLQITGYEEDTSDFGDKLLNLRYNYVYIQTFNTAFAHNYSKYFKDESEIVAGCAYKVVDSNGDVLLERILPQ